MDQQSVNRFLDYVKKDCLKSKVRFTFSKKRYVKMGSIKCNGYFDDTRMELAVAGGQPTEKWLKILVHEYGHMTQWKAHCKVWKNVTKNGDCEAIIGYWTDHEIELTSEQKARHILHSRDVELDCEKRTVRLIKKFKLPIDINAYIKNANAYVYFWTYVGKGRKWYKIGKEPYNSSEIVELMPENFNNNYDKIPSKVEKLFKGLVN